MIKLLIILLYVAGFAVVGYGQASGTKIPKGTEVICLKNTFRDKFYIGVAINQNQVKGTDKRSQDIISGQFNSISPENDLKWEKIHPERETYNFKPTDDYVALGIKNNMMVIGHTLVWHSQTPDWVFHDKSGQPLDREALLEVMRNHITTVVTRYKGKIHGWDVVNEAFNEDGSLRQSKWLTIIGEDYIEKAFEYAHEADPNAELYYNEYNLYKSEKRTGVLKLIDRLKAKNILITGIGEQGHYSLNNPAIGDIETMMKDFIKKGVVINFTELDINVLPDKDSDLTADISTKENYNIAFNPYSKGLPDKVLESLANRYHDLFKLFVKYSDNISRITFWGLTDGDSWLNNWPMAGRTNYPLLFDRDYQPKARIFDALKNTF